jgi:hypothetical protein
MTREIAESTTFEFRNYPPNISRIVLPVTLVVVSADFTIAFYTISIIRSVRREARGGPPRRF